MKKFILLVSVFLLIGTVSAENTRRRLFPDNKSVNVQFQHKPRNSKSWSSATVTLRGSTTVSMMKNEISRRFPNSQIRILSVNTGETVKTFVRFQTSRNNGKAWSSGSITLTNALTESMAKNQIMRMQPGAKVRILSMQNR